jgi:aspartate racemase
MPKHIGIVGCSAEGAALCYRTVCLEAESLMGKHAHPEVTMHTIALAEYMRYLQSPGPYDWKSIAELMLRSADALKRAGADFLICPDNTIHQAMPHVLPRSPLPWLHIAEEVGKEARVRSYSTLGLTGTKYLVESQVYPEKLSLESLFYVQQVMEQMKNNGCDAVVLGCTEIPLLVNDDDSPLPTLDSTRTLARAALREALA